MISIISFNPSEKYESQLDNDIPNIWKRKAMFQTNNQVPSHQVTIPERLELRLDGVAASSSGGGAGGAAGAGPGVADMARGARTRPCWGDLVGNLWKLLEKEGF